MPVSKLTTRGWITMDGDAPGAKLMPIVAATVEVGGPAPAYPDLALLTVTIGADSRVHYHALVPKAVLKALEGAEAHREVEASDALPAPETRP